MAFVLDFGVSLEFQSFFSPEFIGGKVTNLKFPDFRKVYPKLPVCIFLESPSSIMAIAYGIMRGDNFV